MEVISNIKSLQNLVFSKTKNTVWLEYHKLVEFLNKHKTEEEPQVLTSNILRELRSYKDGIKEFNEKRYVHASAVLKYFAKHSEQYGICQIVFDDIVGNIFETNDGEENTVFKLYKQTASLDLWSDDELDSFHVPESESLYKDYKSTFTVREWKKICLFELHFKRNSHKLQNFDEEIQEKQKFLDRLLISKKIAEKTAKSCEHVIQLNQLRKQASDEIHGVNCIHNDITHSFVKLDKTLNAVVQEYYSECLKCVSVSCSKVLCSHSGDIHIFVETKEQTKQENLQSVAQILQYETLRQHNLLVAFFIFVKEGTFSQYVCKYCGPENIHRFELQSDFATKHTELVNDTVLLTNETDYEETDVFVTDSNVKLCRNCFESVSPWIFDPLDWRSIDIAKEWVLNIPIEIQLFFTEWFLNKDSIKRSSNPRQLIKNRLTRLYTLFDGGLSVRNRNYQGVIQQLNSEELMVNYHSLSTVFNITSHSGCTQSLKAADRWLKTAADPNKSHYETYLKKYPLLYQSVNENEESTHYVNLQDCYLVLFMDNLVRLSTHQDPDPGMNRTSQICTLPITLKGLPKDHKIAESWHDDKCTGQNDCKCFEKGIFGEEGEKLLLEQTEEEKHSWKTFQLQVLWGVLKTASRDGVLSEILDISNNGNAEALGELDISMKSLTLDDDGHPLMEDNHGKSLTDADLVSESTRKSEEEETACLTTMEELEAEFEISLGLEETIDEYQFIEELKKLNHDSLFQGIPDPISPDMSTDELQAEHNEKNSTETRDHLLPDFKVPVLHCRHPVPATGRDDSITNIRQVLKEIIQKLERSGRQQDRILFAPDHKISQSVLKLMKENEVFQQLLPEFPALHLRKSKIVNLFAAYEKVGLQHLIKYMKDSEQENDWHKLITLENIETATHNIIRLTAALHLRAVRAFVNCLEDSRKQEFIADVQTLTVSGLEKEWGQRFKHYLKKGSEVNAVFALHSEIMQHCDEIVAIAVAERIGGRSGYSLLLSSVKSSLPFAFLNGSSSYAAFCVDLLHEHYQAGTFHQNMKMSLFSTPHKESSINLALDTQREMDHRDVIKGFRPQSTLDNVVPRMTIVDHFTEVHKARGNILKEAYNKSDTEHPAEHQKPERGENDQQFIQFSVTQKDWRHILPVCQLLTRLEAFRVDEVLIPRNIYDPKEPLLPCEILDSNSYEVGQFLIKKYAASNELFGLDKSKIPSKEAINGPSALIKKALGKSTTVRRVSRVQSTLQTTSENEIAEKKRQAKVKKQSKVIDCMSSSMNACQSLINPDGSKATVQKSTGVKKAILKAIQSLASEQETPKQIDAEVLILDGTDTLPLAVINSVTHATIEFAGIKFKSKATTGEEYIKHIEHGILKKVLNMFPNITSIVVCEEKYTFTPDDFKGATRKKRQKQEQISIAHLKQGGEILSDRKLSRSAVLQTGEGRKLISNYLARNLSKLNLEKSTDIIVDSELVMCNCEFDCADECEHKDFALPIKASYGPFGYLEQQIMTDVHQRKGEAEMAQIDWLNNIQSEMTQNGSVLSIVTSEDIDSVVIHMFAISLHWNRNSNGTFKNSVYVLLQKGIPEIYNITKLIQYFESALGFKYAALNIAIICLMGGNDFIPKYNV